MVVLSVMRVASAGLQSLRAPLLRNSANLLRKPNNVAVAIRQMGSQNKMVIKPSTFEFTLFKDHLHFFFLLGLIPIGALITYVNLFIGKAELADIPEDYEPKHWEYYPHPIQRWFAKNVYDNPQKTYEIACHVAYTENEKRLLRKLEKKVKTLMKERGDYKGWYYVPANTRKVYRAREVDEERQREYGTPPA